MDKLVCPWEVRKRSSLDDEGGKMPAKTIDVEEIKWKFLVPDPSWFPCLICEHRAATHRVTLDDDGVIVKVHVCVPCIPRAGEWLERRHVKKEMPGSRAFSFV